MTTLYEGAFAKLNLTLDVLGKREDGYHDLQSVMQGISIREELKHVSAELEGPLYKTIRKTVEILKLF